MNYSNIVNSSDPNQVVDGMIQIKTNYLANGYFLPLTNVLRSNSISAINDHFRNGIHIQQDTLKEYMATSVIAHCFDGWSYLSQAIDSLLKGDKGSAIHLAYYAELRGTMSFLSRQGVLVNNFQHLGISSQGVNNCTVHEGTHKATWKFLDAWINSNTVSHLPLLNYFTVKGKSFNHWVNSIPSSVSPQVASNVTLQWLKEWSFDVQNYEDDRTFRNTVSYQPQRIVDNLLIDYKAKFKGITNVWRFIEPNATDKFSLLDKYLFSLLFDNIHKNSLPPSANITLQQLISQTFSADGSNEDISINSILSQGINNQLFTTARNNAITSNSGELMPLNIISRALLILRISSGCAFDLLSQANVNKSQIDFYLNNLGNNSGFWKGSTPGNLDMLWDDVMDSISFIDELLQEPDDIVLKDMYDEWPKELHYFKQISRASFWGSCA